MVKQTPSFSFAPFRNIIDGYKDLLDQAPPAPSLDAPPLSLTPRIRDTAKPCAVILSPHPDDETLTGGLALRLRQEENWTIVVIAATLGSNEARRNARKDELAQACAVLGFEGILPTENGLNDVTLDARTNAPLAWHKKSERINALLQSLAPNILFLPHSNDGHATHSGTHALGIDALAAMPKDFSCTVIETEYWSPLPAPNTLIGLSEETVAHLMAALACHVGEVSRNPYDRRFPAFLIDTIRRSENLLGAGETPPPMTFGQLYRQGLWRKGRFMPSALRRFVGEQDSLTPLFD